MSCVGSGWVGGRVIGWVVGLFGGWVCGWVGVLCVGMLVECWVWCWVVGSGVGLLGCVCWVVWWFGVVCWCFGSGVVIVVGWSGWV